MKTSEIYGAVLIAWKKYTVLQLENQAAPNGWNVNMIYDHSDQRKGNDALANLGKALI